MSQPFIKFVYFLPSVHSFGRDARYPNCTPKNYDVRLTPILTYVMLQCNVPMHDSAQNCLLVKPDECTIIFHQYHNASLISVNTNQIRKYRIAIIIKYQHLHNIKYNLIIYVIYINCYKDE